MVHNERNGGLKPTTDLMFNKFVVLTSIAFGFAVLAIMILINDQQPNAYMDEIFHVKQTQMYCKGNFSYVWTDLLCSGVVRLNHLFSLVEPQNHNSSRTIPDDSRIPQTILRAVRVRRRGRDEDMSGGHIATHECHLHVR